MMYPFWFSDYGYYNSSPVFMVLSTLLFCLAVYSAYMFFEHGREKKWLWVFVCSIILLAFSGSSGMMGFGIISLGMAFGMLMMVLFWGAIIWLVFSLFKSIVSGSENSQELLKKRYAKGEISKKQFEAMKKDLR